MSSEKRGDHWTWGGDKRDLTGIDLGRHIVRLRVCPASNRRPPREEAHSYPSAIRGGPVCSIVLPFWEETIHLPRGGGGGGVQAEAPLSSRSVQRWARPINSACSDSVMAPARASLSDPPPRGPAQGLEHLGWVELGCRQTPPIVSMEELAGVPRKVGFHLVTAGPRSAIAKVATEHGNWPAVGTKGLVKS